LTGFQRYGVAPETLVLTDKGHERIASLDGKEVSVWTGNDFESTSVFKVATEQKILRVTVDNGAEISCSDSHIFYVQPGYKTDVINPTPASELYVGDRLMKAQSYPITLGGTETFPHAYTHGFFVGAERFQKKNGSLSRASIFGARRVVLDDLDIERTDKQTLYFPETLPAMWEIPLSSEFSLETKLEWLAGLFDGGLIKRKNTDRPIWHLYSTSGDFLTQVKLLVQTLGGDTRVIANQDLGRFPYSFRISGQAMQNLIKLNIPTRTHKFPVIDYKRRGITTPKIAKIEDDYRTTDVYNFVGTEGHGAIFNGIYTSSN